jgi:sterol desaturase/sphingolipid hydroxylase (fatty acid hydroxylase superfamily)
MSDTKIYKAPKTNSMAAISTYVVISIVIFSYGMFAIEKPWLLKLGFLAAGLLLFTLMEYVFHRFVYHSGDDYMAEENWQYKVHGVHHDHPTDKDLLAMPIPLAILLSAIFFGLFWLMMKENSFFFWPGFFTGYAAYLYVHYIVHTRKPPQNAFKILWTHHHLHHYVYDDKAYGVSSPLWDVIFGTMPPKNQPIPRQKRRKAKS